MIPSKDISFDKSGRILIVAAHPDDEALGCAGVIQAALKAHADVKVVYMTHGDQNEISSIIFKKRPLWRRSDFIRHGQLRKKEAIEGMAVLGVNPKKLILLGYPDNGLMTIWRKHRDGAKPFRSMRTRIHRVPNPDDFSYGSPYCSENIINDLQKILLLYQPTHVFVSAPFDRHSDHRASYLFMQKAFLGLNGRIQRAYIYTYLIHERQWPQIKKYLPGVSLTAPPKNRLAVKAKWISFHLTHHEVTRKKEVLLRHRSQIAYNKNFMLSFVRTNELFAEISLQYEGTDGVRGGAVKGGKWFRCLNVFWYNSALRAHMA